MAVGEVLNVDADAVGQGFVVTEQGLIFLVHVGKVASHGGEVRAETGDFAAQDGEVGAKIPIEQTARRNGCALRYFAIAEGRVGVNEDGEGIYAEAVADGEETGDRQTGGRSERFTNVATGDARQSKSVRPGTYVLVVDKVAHGFAIVSAWQERVDDVFIRMSHGVASIGGEESADGNVQSVRKLKQLLHGDVGRVFLERVEGGILQSCSFHDDGVRHANDIAKCHQQRGVESNWFFHKASFYVMKHICRFFYGKCFGFRNDCCSFAHKVTKKATTNHNFFGENEEIFTEFVLCAGRLQSLSEGVGRPDRALCYA